MFSLIISITKVLLIGLWVFALLGLLSMSPLTAQYQFYVSILAAIVLLVHFIEYLIMKAKVKSKAKLPMSFIQTMLWGFGYWLPLFKNK
jgi:uncharacterized protein YhhL (DUF1145 family)